MRAPDRREGSFTAPSALRVRLLGNIEIRRGEEPLPPLGSARAESVLAYLLLHRDAPQPRERLAFLMWPDSTEPQARTNLRHVLHTLRRALPDADHFLEATSRTLRWRSDAPCWLDVAVFERAVADRELREAVDLYAGDLLEGNYDEWLLEERERLAHLYVDTLERLIPQLEEEKRWRDAIGYAEQLLRRDPLREETYRRLIGLFDASGDRARALRAYHVCEATLQRELGIEPSAATRQAYEALLPLGPEPKSPELAPASPAGPPIVGRVAERTQLTALWRAVGGGRAHLVLVSGEAGVGKSRLVEELRSWCAHGGAVTAEARAYGAEGTMAYGAVIAWLRSDRIAPRLRRLDRAHLSELARLLPELAANMPDLALPEPLPETEQRQRLFDSVARAIIGAGAPLLLVIDDVQWCDPLSLQFVHYLLRSEPAARVLVAASARREEIDAAHPVSQLITGLHALGCITEIALERLGREETAMLAEWVAGRPLSTAETGRLYAESEGNPLFVVEAVRAGVHAATVREPQLSPKVQAVIASRLARLSAPAGELVAVAATIGREFTTQVLSDASGTDEQTFVRSLDELWRRGLVRAHGVSAYDFSHGKIRETASGSLSPAQQRHNHLRVARALERSYARDADAISSQIASHYDAAGAALDALTWYERAAVAAQKLHANEDAVRFLERALELARALHDGAERASLELRLLAALPAPQVALEGYLSQRLGTIHERALKLAAAFNVELEASLLRSLALASLTRGDFEAVRAFGAQLRARAERDDDEMLWVESAYVLGVADYWQGHLLAASAHFEGAVGRYRPDQRAAHLMHYGQDPQVVCLMRLAHTLWLLGRDDEAERTRDAALTAADESGHPYTRDVATLFAAILALDQGDVPMLRRYAEELGSRKSVGEARQLRSPAEAFAGHLDVCDGRTEQGLERIRRVIADARAGLLPAPGHLAVLLRVLLEACAIAGQADGGLAAANEALEAGGGTELWEAEIRRLRAGFLQACGTATDEIEAELERAVDVAHRQGAHPFEHRARESLSRFRAGTR